MFRLNYLDLLILILLVLGGLNWGLIGVWNFNLVAYLFGAMTLVSKIIYIIVGLAALYVLYLLIRYKGFVGR